MKDKIAIGCIMFGIFALYHKQWLKPSNIEYLLLLLKQYWPYALIITGFLLMMPNKSKRS